MIYVVGDIMLDQYVYGSSTRQSPENAKAPVVKIFDTHTTVGGAGNVAINVAALGEPVALIGAYSAQGALSKAIAEATVDWHNLTVYSAPNLAKDIVKTRIYSNNEYIVRVDEDHEVDTGGISVSTLLEHRCKLSDKSIIVLSDYGKGTVKNPADLINLAYKTNSKILVDPKGDLKKYAGATILKPNLKEFCDWLGFYDSTDINLLNSSILEHSRKELSVEYLIVTLGAEGCIVVNEKTSALYKPLDIKPIDVTGAGDTFIAALAVSLHKDDSMHKAITFANRVASISVTKRGTSYVRSNEI